MCGHYFVQYGFIQVCIFYRFYLSALFCFLPVLCPIRCNRHKLYNIRITIVYIVGVIVSLLTESVEFISARFDEYEADHKEKDEMINNLEEKVLGLTEKVDKLSSLVDRKGQYPRRNCILIHGVQENQNEDTDEVAINKIKSEMDLEISPEDIDRTHRIGVPSKGKNRTMIVKFVR